MSTTKIKLSKKLNKSKTFNKLLEKYYTQNNLNKSNSKFTLNNKKLYKEKLIDAFLKDMEQKKIKNNPLYEDDYEELIKNNIFLSNITDYAFELFEKEYSNIEKQMEKKKSNKTHTVNQLKKICKEKGIKGYSKLRKKELMKKCL